MNDIRLIHGDCLACVRTLESGSVDAVVTDPPYSLVAGGRSYSIHKGGYFGDKATCDAAGPGLLFHTPAFSEWIPVLSDCLAVNAEALVFTNDRNISPLWDTFKANGWRWHNLITWDKRIKVQNRHYMKQCEYILYLFRGKTRRLKRGGIANLLRHLPPNPRCHPSEKPVSLLAELIEAHDCETILDPFMGSGTTGAACVQTGRKFIGIEIDAGYFKIAKKRIAAAQAETPLIAGL